MDKHGTVNRTKTDSQGRTWVYNDAEGCWSHGPHTIGCGAKNGSKWAIWNGPQRSQYEHKTLRDAMLACY